MPNSQSEYNSDIGLYRQALTKMLTGFGRCKSFSAKIILPLHCRLSFCLTGKVRISKH